MIQRVLLWICLSSLLALAGALVAGKLYAAISVLSLVGAGFLSLKLSADKLVFKKTNWDEEDLFALFILGIGFFQFFYLIFESQGHFFAGNPNNFGDLPLHINYIRGFANGVHFWPLNPEFSLEPLKYPFGMDLFNALFDSIGVPLRAHLFLVGMLGLFLSIQALRRVAGFWGLAVFFLSGAYGSANQLWFGTSWLPGTDIDWKNLFLALFVTQRGYLFALPAGLWLLSELQKSVVDRGKQITMVLVWGSLAFFHLHTFFILSLYLGLKALLMGDWKKKWSLFVGAGMVAMPFLMISIFSGSNLGKTLGWMGLWNLAAQAAGETTAFVYLMKNFGPWLAALPIVFWLATLKSNWREKLTVALPGILFVIFLFIKVAPWAWDNIKVLMWCYMFLHLVFYEQFVRQLSKKWQWGIALLFFYPGLFQLLASTPSRIQAVKFSPPVLQTECDLSQLAANDVIAGSPDFDHVLMFQGRLMALGYDGHVWSHGYNLASRQNRLETLMKKKPQWPQAAKEMGAKWVFWGQNEKARYGAHWGSELSPASLVADLELCGAKIYDLASTSILNPSSSPDPGVSPSR